MRRDCWIRRTTLGAALALAFAAEARAQGGETCATAQLLPCGAVQVPTSTVTAANDYDQAGACTGFASEGPDVVFRIELVAGGALDLTFDGPYDASIYLITDCGDPVNTCVAGSDTYPPGLPDAIAYTNNSGATQTLYLVVDGFSDIDFGPGVLAGTIACTGTPSVTGACCNRATGGCSITTNFECAGTDGIFHGEGSACSPTPCPPAESRCIEPGLSVTRDAAGDHDPQLGNRQLDVLRVSFAEPYSATADDMVITLEVDQLDPANLPLNALWTVFWTNPGTSDPYPRKFVQMTTCDPLQIPGFVYGHAEPQATGGDLNRTDGDISGSFDPDGTIRLVVPRALVGSPAPGQTLGDVVGSTFVFAPGGNCSGLINTVDETPAGAYALAGDEFCRPITTTCAGPFTASANDGEVPVTFTVRNPSTATRRVTATVSDANGWVVGGPVTRTLNLAPGGQAQVEARVAVPEDCAPSSAADVEFRVTAADLPAPDGTVTCVTAVACETVTGGVAEDGAGLSLALRTNPIRAGGTVLAYTLPARGPVRIELYTAAGQRVRTLVDAVHEPGAFTVPLRVEEAAGRRLAPGMYLVRLTAGAERRSVRAIVLR